MYKLALLPALAVLLLFAGCGDDDDDAPTDVPVTSAAATSHAATATAGPTLTRAPSATPTGTPAWTGYTDPVGHFSFSYPPDWYIETYGDADPGHVRLASFPLENWNGQFHPGDNAIDVEFGVTHPTDTRPDGATDTTLGGRAAYESEAPIDTSEGGDATWSYSHGIFSVQGDSTYAFLGYFGDNPPDQATFDAILATFHYTD